MESKEQQKQLITEIMDLDAKDGLYDTVNDTVNELDKLAHQYNPVMKLDAEFIRAGFKAGYNKAKETLYTEEQVRDLMYWASKMTLEVWHKHKSEQRVMVELHEKIQSLKQPKKD